MAGAIFFVNSNATGANTGLNEADAFLTLLQGMQAASTGDFIKVSHTHNETVSNVQYICEGQIIISIDFADGSYRKGAIVDSRPNADISFTQSTLAGVHSYGVDYAVGDDLKIIGIGQIFEDCTITLPGFGDKLDLFTKGYGSFINIVIEFGDTGAIIEFSGGSILWKGGRLGGGAANLITGFGQIGNGVADIEDVDLSLVDNLVAVTGIIQENQAIFRDCELKSGYTLHTGIIGRDSLIAIYSKNLIQEAHAQGVAISETTIVKTGGSSDGVTPISMKMITGADASRHNPLRIALPINLYLEAGDYTLELDTVIDDVVNLTDAEAYFTASIPGATAQHNILSNAPSTPLADPVDLPASTAIWTITGMSNPNKQKMILDITVEQAGVVEINLFFARASAIMYVDLKAVSADARQYLSRAYINGEARDYSVPTDPGETIRQQIIDVLTTRFATILIANGYKTDMGNNVTHWRASTADVAQAKLPHLGWEDANEDDLDATVGQVDHLLSITCKISVKTEADIYKARADLIKMIGTDVFMSGLAGDTTLPVEQGDVHQGSKKIWTQEYKFTIEYPTDRFDEYTQ